MNALTKRQYLENPCRAASVPYWKAVRITVPDSMRIVHDSQFGTELLEQYTDEPYFRLQHPMLDVKPAPLPEGYFLCEASALDFVNHINSCYADIHLSMSEMQTYLTREQYRPELWVAVREGSGGKIVATGIAELDGEMGEGILEWIQVSKEHRRCGLGSYLVSELLWRMRNTAGFVTVSGKCNSPEYPEKLYRKCGFEGKDIWHILSARKDMSANNGCRFEKQI